MDDSQPALTPDELELVRAVVRLILPPGEEPGAEELNVAEVIAARVRYTPGLIKLYRDGLEGLNRTSELMYGGRPFLSLSESEQLHVLSAVEQGTAPASASPSLSPQAFFATIRRDAVFVYTTDPKVWESIGFPGPSIGKGGYPDCC